MYNFEQVLNRLSWLCLFLFFSRVLLLGGRDRREGGWMSKGDERRVLRNRGEKFGWSGERELSFPSYIYFLTILSVSHLSNFDSRFFCSFGRFTSLHLKTDGKLQHNLKVKEDCEVLTTMGLIHQACVCTNLCYFTLRCMPSMPPNLFVLLINILCFIIMFLVIYRFVMFKTKLFILYWAYSTIFIYLVKSCIVAWKGNSNKLKTV